MQYLKDAGGLKLVVYGAGGREVAAMFVRGSVSYEEEEFTAKSRVTELSYPSGRMA